MTTYYISPTGSDANPGTLASPWSSNAINSKQSTYAGQTVYFMPGYYDLSSKMNSTYHTPVLNINGGPNVATPTLIATCDYAGNYKRGTAILDAKGASGQYGGGNNCISSIIGQGFEVNPPANWGNWILDGFYITGFSLWAVNIGNYDGSNNQVPNAIVRNCEITGGNAQNTTQAMVSI